MAVSANGASARNLFVESKLRLAERIQFNVNSAGSVARQIIRGSKSNDVLMHTARNFALQEYAIDNSESNLKRMALLAAHLHFQVEAIQKSAEVIETVKDQLSHIQRSTVQPIK